MELNQPVIQDLLRQLFAATMAADEARAQAFGHLDGLRDLIPEWIEKIACEGNSDGTATLRLGDKIVDLSWADVQTERALEKIVEALKPPPSLEDARRDLHQAAVACGGPAPSNAAFEALRRAVARYDEIKAAQDRAPTPKTTSTSTPAERRARAVAALEAAYLEAERRAASGDSAAAVDEARRAAPSADARARFRRCGYGARRLGPAWYASTSYTSTASGRRTGGASRGRTARVLRQRGAGPEAPLKSRPRRGIALDVLAGSVLCTITHMPFTPSGECAGPSQTRTKMSRGPSGRIVVEIDPQTKNELHAALALQGTTLKNWFLTCVNHYLAHSNQLPLRLDYGPDRKAVGPANGDQ